MTTQYVSYGLEDAVASTVVPPGRYFIETAWVIDNFDYNKTQKAGTAVVLRFKDDQGRTWDQEYGVGDKTRIYPDPEGQRLIGAPLSETCTWFFLLKHAQQMAGLPATKLWEGDIPAKVSSIFAGIWGDWINVIPEGRAKTRKRTDGQVQDAIGVLVPSKLFMDGGAAPSAPPRAASAPVAAPPATPPPPTATPPPAVVAPPAAPPPPPATAAPPPPPVAPPGPANGVSIDTKFGEMLDITRAMLVNPSTENTRRQLMTEVFNGISVEGLAELDAAQLRADAMTSVMGAFTEYLTSNGMKVEGEVVSVA